MSSAINFSSERQRSRSFVKYGPFYIKAELGRALSQWEQPIFMVRPPKKTTGAITIKSGMNDDVGEGNPHAIGNIEITGGFST